MEIQLYPIQAHSMCDFCFVVWIRCDSEFWINHEQPLQIMGQVQWVINLNLNR